MSNTDSATITQYLYNINTYDGDIGKSFFIIFLGTIMDQEVIFMKETTILLSIVVAGAIAWPTTANAKSEYPAYSKRPTDICGS